MNNVYSPENQEQATFDLLRAIYHDAKKRDKHFDESNYRWSLGVEVINDIANRLQFVNAKDVPMALFGIPGGRDYSNPQNVELWKNVTNE